MNVSLCMIGKLSERHQQALQTSLRSMVPYVQEVCFLDNGSPWNPRDLLAAICAEYDVPLKYEWYEDPNKHPEHGWTSDFANLRNRCQALVTSPVWCWLDTDSVMVNGASWRQLVEEAFTGDKNALDIMEVRYDYSHDAAGKCNHRVPTNQVFRTGYTEWRYPVHEQAWPLRMCRFGSASDKDFYMEHLPGVRDSKGSAARNLWIVERYEAQGGEMTARMLGNKADCLMRLGRMAEALDRFAEAIDSSEEPDERYRLMIHAIHAHREVNDHEGALRVATRAAALFPQRKTPWLHMAVIAMDQGRFPEAIGMVKRADALPPDPYEGTSFNPVFIAFSGQMVLVKSYMAMDDVRGAAKAAEFLQPHRDKDPEIDALCEEVDTLFDQTVRYQCFRAVCDTLPQNQAEEVWRAAPYDLILFPEVARAHRPARDPRKRRVAFFCGPSVKPWDAMSLGEGVGGSEKCVIFLSRAMAAQGWQVDVYGMPRQAQIGLDEHGVCWLPHYAWDDPEVDVFVGWRVPKFLAHASRAQQRWLWLHDVVYAPLFSPDAAAMATGVFCLTDFHAAPLRSQDAWKGKVYLTANGLDPDEIRDGPNHQHRFIYASSPDRGMLPLLEQWPVIRTAIPDAELHLYYGFTANYLRDMRNNPKLRRTKERIEAQLQRVEGVHWHGMVGQDELASAFAQSGFWLYPTAWPETFCITAAQAQANGAIPITSRYPDSGVPETCRYDLGPEPRGGSIYDDPAWLTAWTDQVVKVASKEPDHAFRKEMKAWARETFSWKKVAADWTRLFSARSNLERQAEQAGSMKRQATPS